MKPIIAIDCETGGLDETKHALLSVGLVELDADLCPVRLKEVFIKPMAPSKEHNPITKEAVDVNGYSEKEWDRNSAKCALDSMCQIVNWLPKDFTFIAHNAEFDKKFFEHNTSLFFYKYEKRDWICTKKLYQSIAGDPCNLSTAAVKVGHWPEDYSRKVHGALIDALACAAVYKWCMKQSNLLTQDIEKDSPLKKFYENPFPNQISEKFQKIFDKIG